MIHHWNWKGGKMYLINVKKSSNFKDSVHQICCFQSNSSYSKHFNAVSISITKCIVTFSLFFWNNVGSFCTLLLKTLQHPSSLRSAEGRWCVQICVEIFRCGFCFSIYSLVFLSFAPFSLKSFFLNGSSFVIIGFIWLAILQEFASIVSTNSRVC